MSLGGFVRHPEFSFGLRSAKWQSEQAIETEVFLGSFELTKSRLDSLRS